MIIIRVPRFLELIGEGHSSTALGGRLGLAVARTRVSVLLHPMAKRVGVQIQDLSCALWSLNDAAGPLKGSKDVTTLYLVQG